MTEEQPDLSRFDEEIRRFYAAVAIFNTALMPFGKPADPRLIRDSDCLARRIKTDIMLSGRTAYTSACTMPKLRVLRSAMLQRQRNVATWHRLFNSLIWPDCVTDAEGQGHRALLGCGTQIRRSPHQ